MIQWSLLAAFTLVSIGFSQSLPGFHLIQELVASGMDSVAGLGTDAQGNVYIVGTTSSQQFPVKNAVQPNIASAGLYRVSGSAFTALGLSSCSFLAVDLQNPSAIYAVSHGTLVKSVNSSVTFATTTLPSSHALSIAIQPGNDQILFAGTFD
jgi:Beta-propeller repeat